MNLMSAAKNTKKKVHYMLARRDEGTFERIISKRLRR